MGKDVQPLQSVKNWYTSRAHGHERPWDSYIKGDESCCVKKLIDYCLMLYIIYVTLIMRPWDPYYLVAILAEFVLDSFLLSPPHLRRSIGLMIN